MDDPPAVSPNSHRPVPAFFTADFKVDTHGFIAHNDQVLSAIQWGGCSWYPIESRQTNKNMYTVNSLAFSRYQSSRKVVYNSYGSKYLIRRYKLPQIVPVTMAFQGSAESEVNLSTRVCLRLLNVFAFLFHVVLEIGMKWLWIVPLFRKDSGSGRQGGR